MWPLNRLPSRFLTPRGWGFILAAALILLLAQILGRRDLLHLGFLAAALPLVSLLGLRLLKPRFTVRRVFSPPTMATGSTTTVHLTLSSFGTLPGAVAMVEDLPARFGEAPRFSFPARHLTRSGESLYRYRLRCSLRGAYEVGPVSAEFTDTFGLGTLRHRLGPVSGLLVTPSPLDLPHAAQPGTWSAEGSEPTRTLANPSNDDVMTREYRHGDSLRRVHWAASARHNELMVRQEEAAATPAATLVMDQRQGSFEAGTPAPLGAEAGSEGNGLLSSPAFEWAVTAVVSISAHLLESRYALRFLDQHSLPAVRRCPSAPLPDEEEYQGPGSLQDIADGLATLQLDTEAGSRAFDDAALDRLAAGRRRGPLIAVLGSLSTEEAVSLGTAAAEGLVAYAIMVTERPGSVQEQLDVLRSAGWYAAAASPETDLAALWASLGQAADDVVVGSAPALPEAPS